MSRILWHLVAIVKEIFPFLIANWMLNIPFVVGFLLLWISLLILLFYDEMYRIPKSNSNKVTGIENFFSKKSVCHRLLIINYLT